MITGVIIGVVLMGIGMSLILLFEVFRFRVMIQLSKEKEEEHKAEQEKEQTKREELNLELTNSYKEIVKLQNKQVNTQNYENQRYGVGEAIGKTFEEITK